MFDLQNLPDEELEAGKKYQQYALLIGDSMSYIKNLELSAKAYYLKGDTMKVLDVLNKAHELYLEQGCSKEAIALYGPIINEYVRTGDYSTAGKLINEYESSSGLFDSEGKISSGREVYYYIRGTYYLGKQEFSLADADFNRLLDYGLYVDAYRGKLSLFNKLNKPDSVFKYARLLEDATEAKYAFMRTMSVKRISSLYQYHSYQRKAEQSARKARKVQQTTVLVGSLGVLICLLCFVSYRRYRKNKLIQIQQLADSYSKARDDFQKLSDEIETLKTDYKQLTSQKETEIEDLKSLLKKFEGRWQSVSRNDKEVVMLNSGIVKIFHEKARNSFNISPVSEYEWQKLLFQFQNSMAAARIIMEDGERRLSESEMRACILLLLGFTNSELSTLLNVSPQRITNIKSIINQKLFGDSLSSTLLRNIKRELMDFV